jgi:tetratricopeptide (TPR) repeat protein
MMRAIRGIALLAGAAAAQDDALRTGLVHFHRGEYTAAVTTLEKAPQSPHRRVFLALARAATGGCDAARTDLADSFERAPETDLRRLAGLGLAQCLIAQNQLEESLPVLARLRAQFPDDADVLYQAARTYHRLWNDAVFQMFQKTPASFRVNQVSAEIFEIQGRYGDAIQEYRKAIEKNPAAVNLHYRLGRALLLQSHAPENLELARQEFEAELALNPGDAVAHYQIAQILLSQQKTEAALARFERAVALQLGGFPEAHLAIGKVYLDRKQYAEAIARLEKVVAAQPKNEGARYALMLAYRNAGRAEDAAREAAALESLRQPPEGEFTEFLKRIGEKPPPP